MSWSFIVWVHEQGAEYVRLRGWVDLTRARLGGGRSRGALLGRFGNGVGTAGGRSRRRLGLAGSKFHSFCGVSMSLDLEGSEEVVRH